MDSEVTTNEWLPNKMIIEKMEFKILYFSYRQFQSICLWLESIGLELQLLTNRAVWSVRHLGKKNVCLSFWKTQIKLLL